MTITIKKATLEDTPLVHPLFVAYRDFYQEAPTEASLSFLEERIRNQEAIVLLAMKDAETAMGFTLLYPSFNSLSLEKIYILNDLFVAPSYREQGVGRHLLNAAQKLAEISAVKEITLMTHVNNEKAQKLYHACGYRLIQDFLTLSLTLDCTSSK